MKRVIISLLSAVITFSSLPGSVLAASTQETEPGTVIESQADFSDEAGTNAPASIENVDEGTTFGENVDGTAIPDENADEAVIPDENAEEAAIPDENAEEAAIPDENADEAVVSDENADEAAPATDNSGAVNTETGGDSKEDTVISESSDDETVKEEEFIYVNPLYQDVISEEELIELPKDEGHIKEKQSGKKKTASALVFYSTFEEAGAFLCERMINREESVVIPVDKTSDDFSGLENREIYNGIIQQAFVENEDCHSGDYLRFQYAGFRIGTATTETSVELRFTVTYFTTAEQENEMDAAVAQAMEELNLQDADEAHKILGIYSYITDNVEYDSENVDNQSYTLKYSAYAALIDRKAVCQGYACLFYRMCREADLSVRVISGRGTTDSQSALHTWNIVRIGELYYNADPTWDAGRSVDEYQCFLKCEDDFTGHVRDSNQKMDYTSPEFYSEYPMSDTNYEFADESAKIIVQPEDVNAGISEPVTLHVEASGDNLSYQWQWSREGISWRDCTYAGCDTDTFSFNMKASYHGRSYRCIVTAGGKTLISDEAHISLVSKPLEIIAQPGDVSAAAGDRVVLHVEAIGSGIKYQWQWTKDGKTWRNCTYAGYNTDTFSFTMKTSLAGRYYRCLVSTSNEELISDRALLILEESIQILAQPENVTAAAGEKVVLHIEAEGSGINYQWQWTKDGKTWNNCTYAGYNTDTFRFDMKKTLAGRSYRCIVSDSSGTKIISSTALISLKKTGGDLPQDLQKYEELSSEYNSSGIHTASFKYGTSVQGRDLVGWMVAPKSYDQTILLNFEIHGWEDLYAADGQCLVDLGNAVRSHYSEASDLSGCRLIIIPSCNPDGLAEGTTNNGFGRCNADGIDLNRDFDVAYQSYSSERNYTPYAFSGKESAALRDLVYATDPSIAIDFHGWLNYTIGDSDLAEVFSLYCGLNHKYEFTANAHGYFAYWAQEQGAKGLLVEFKDPESLNYGDVIEALDHLIEGDFGTESAQDNDDQFTGYCPITTYAMTSERVYTQKAPGNSGTDYGYIDGMNDQCTIIQVYDNGWCKVRYPVSSLTKTGFCEFSKFFASEYAVTPYNASVSTTQNVYRTSDLSTKLGSVWTTDKITVVAEKNNVYQIIYPLDDGGYKMGWISKDAIN